MFLDGVESFSGIADRGPRMADEPNLNHKDIKIKDELLSARLVNITVLQYLLQITR
jgi:hypothetical protein